MASVFFFLYLTSKTYFESLARLAARASSLRFLSAASDIMVEGGSVERSGSGVEERREKRVKKQNRERGGEQTGERGD